MQYYVTYYDDFYATIINENYHGKYFVSWLPVFICSLSKKFNMHYIIWLQTGGAIIKGIILSVLMYFLASCAFIHKKKNFLLPLLMFLSFILYKISTYKFDYLYAAESYTHLSYYVFPFIFYIIFWKRFIDIFIFEHNYNKRNLVITYIFAVILGISNDFIAIATIYSLFIILVFKKFFKKLSYRYLLFMIISLVFSFGCSILSNGFIERATQYGAVRPIPKILEEIIILFNDFNLEYVNVFRSEFLIYTLIIILLFLLLIFQKSKISPDLKRSYLILVPTMCISAFLFYYNLILVGVNPETGSLLQLWQMDLVIEMKLFLLFMIYLELGFLFVNGRNIVYFVIILLSLICLILFNEKIINNIKLLRNIGIKEYCTALQGRGIESI